MPEPVPFWVEAIASALLVGGGLFAVIGALGLARLRDFFMRLHGPTKVSTLGIGLVLIGSMLHTSFAGHRIAVHELLITAFVFLTAPISAHLLARAGLARLRARPGEGRQDRPGTDGEPTGPVDPVDPADPQGPSRGRRG